MAQISSLFILFILIIFPHCARPNIIAAIDPPPPPSQPHVHHGKAVVTPTMAIILACLIATFFLTCFFSIYVHQCVHRQMALDFPGQGPRQNNWFWHEEATVRGVDPRTVASFPTFIYSEIKELKIGECDLECAVCLNEFEDEETLQLLPKCWHVFHPDCIQSWLSSHVTCPVCRANLQSEVSQTDPRVPALRQPSVLEPGDETIVHVQSPDEIRVVHSPTLPPRSTSRKEQRFRATFRKSFSTGHSLGLSVENPERFTLRLPDEVRNQLVNSGLERARSCHVAFPRARSGRKGFRSISGGSRHDRFDRERQTQRWVFTATLPFFSRASPSRPIVIRGGDSEGSVGSTPIGLFKSVTSPLNRFFGGANVRRDGDVDDEERSTDVLVPVGKV